MCSKIKDFKCYKNIQLSVQDFVYQTYGICGDKISQLNHKDLKKLFPELRRVSFETASDSHLLYSGNIILVKDKKGCVLPYARPFTQMIYDEIIIKDEEKSEVINDKDYKELSNYELRTRYKLVNKLKCLGKYKACRLMMCEIKERGLNKPGIRKRKLENIRKKELE